MVTVQKIVESALPELPPYPSAQQIRSRFFRKVAAICGIAALIFCIVLGLDDVLYAIGAAIYDWHGPRKPSTLIDLSGVYLAMVAFHGWMLRDV